MGVRQPFSYYGGKQKMVRHILPIVDSIPHTVYGEPFCGGASVLFAREPRAIGNSNHYREFLNDKNEWVANFYRVGKMRSNELIRLIDATLYSEADYLKAKTILQESNKYDDLTIAWAFYVQANMSFSNKLFGGWGSNVISQNRPETWHNRKTKLPEALNRLSKVAISCGNAIDCIKRWDSSQTLFYLDPPYPETNQGHYSGYALDDYQELCNALDKIQGSYILSNYESDIQPKSVQTQINIKTLCSSSGKGKVRFNKSKIPTQKDLGDRERTETLLICDRSANMRSDIAAIASNHQNSIEPSIKQQLTWLETKVDAIDKRSKRTETAVNQLSIFDVAY
jgi:DNA adenine methylase